MGSLGEAREDRNGRAGGATMLRLAAPILRLTRMRRFRRRRSVLLCFMNTSVLINVGTIKQSNVGNVSAEEERPKILKNNLFFFTKSRGFRSAAKNERRAS